MFLLSCHVHITGERQIEFPAGENFKDISIIKNLAHSTVAGESIPTTYSYITTPKWNNKLSIIVVILEAELI